MYLCYIDESGTPDVPGNTSHLSSPASLFQSGNGATQTAAFLRFWLGTTLPVRSFIPLGFSEPILNSREFLILTSCPAPSGESR